MPTILSYYAQHCMHVPGKWIYYAQPDGGQKALLPPVNGDARERRGGHGTLAGAGSPEPVRRARRVHVPVQAPAARAVVAAGAGSEAGRGRRAG